MCNNRQASAGGEDIEAYRTKALEGLLEAFRREYTEQGQIFSELDRKAQANTTVAGVFLAAVLAFIKLDELAKLLAWGGAGIFFALFGLTVLLIVAVVLSIVGTSMKDCPLPPNPETLDKEVDDVLACRSAQKEQFDNLLNQEILRWKPKIEKYVRINQGKGNTILAAQITLSVAIIGFAVFLVVILVRAYGISLTPTGGG